MRKNKHISYIQASGQPTRHDLLKCYRVMRRLRLMPSEPAWPISFLCRVGPHLERHEPGRAGPTRLIGQVKGQVLKLLIT
jgi:hypothetical protein